MAKLLQTRIATSRLTLPAAIIYGLSVWMAAGLQNQGWWLQLACFGTTIFLMEMLNNIHSLIRIYSRMVSTSFIVMTCSASFLFPSVHEALMQSLMVAFLTVFFTTYQDRESPGRTFYAFLCYGMATLCYVHVLYLLPLVWVLMGTKIMALSWRTWAASVIGLITPYWFALCYIVLGHDYQTITSHFEPLAHFTPWADYTSLTTGQQLVAGAVVLLAIIGTIHFVRKQSQDKMHTRLLFECLIWIDLLLAVLLVLQPAHYDAIMRLMMVCTAPLAGHYITLTSTKITNITCAGLTLLLLTITLYNLWNTLSPS